MTDRSKIVNLECFASKRVDSDPLGLQTIPHKKADKKRALEAARAIRKDIDDYIRDYNIPFPSLR